METYKFYLQPYCENCREFEPDVDEYRAGVDILHVVGCKKGNVCKNIYAFIKKGEKDEEANKIE